MSDPVQRRNVSSLLIVSLCFNFFLAGIVVLGGVGRLVSLLSIGSPSPAMLAALVMELIVTPGLALWQYRVTIGPRQ